MKKNYRIRLRPVEKVYYSNWIVPLLLNRDFIAYQFEHGEFNQIKHEDAWRKSFPHQAFKSLIFLAYDRLPQTPFAFLLIRFLYNLFIVNRFLLNNERFLSFNALCD